MTNQVTIKPLEGQDTALLFELRIKNRVYLAPYEPTASEEHFTLQGQQEHIRKAIIDRENDRGYAFGIWLLESNQLIGRVNLSNVTRGAWQNCTIGYFIDEHMQGKGYVTAAVGQILQIAFQEIELHRIEASVMPWNKASIRLLEKVGFHYIGLSSKHLKINGKWEDHYLYALTVEQWEKKKVLT